MQMSTSKNNEATSPTNSELLDLNGVTIVDKMHADMGRQIMEPSTTIINIV